MHFMLLEAFLQHQAHKLTFKQRDPAITNLEKKSGVMGCLPVYALVFCLL